MSSRLHRPQKFIALMSPKRRQAKLTTAEFELNQKTENILLGLLSIVLRRRFLLNIHNLLYA